MAEANRAFDLTPSQIEEWVDYGKAGMDNALRAKPEDVREQYERQLKDLQEAYREAMLDLRPVGQGRVVMDAIRQGLKEDGFEVSVSKLCAWFGFVRLTVC